MFIRNADESVEVRSKITLKILTYLVLFLVYSGLENIELSVQLTGYDLFTVKYKLKQFIYP